VEYSNNTIDLEKKIIDYFGLFDFDHISPDDIEEACIHCVSLKDDDRIHSIGKILIYLLENLEFLNPVRSLDLFLFGLYPDIYPKIETWEALAIDTDCAPFKKQMQNSQNKFLLKISQCQANVIFQTLNIILTADQYKFSLDEDFETALKLYWESRSNGEIEFAL
jgi:hypothetical protein